MNEINFEIQDIKKIDLSMDVGVKEIFPPIENLEVTPTKVQQVFKHENSYGYDEVVINPIPDEYIIPNGILEITENGVTDVTSYEKVNVNIETTTPEDLKEELNTYNTELTTQEIIINSIIEVLKNKTFNSEVK